MAEDRDMKTASHDELLFVGTNGHVLALEKRTGKTVWTTSLPKTGWPLVAVVYEDEMLYCAAAGRVFAIEPRRGRIRWTNPLRGMSSSSVYLATARSEGTPGATLLADEAETASGDGSTAAASATS